MKMMGGARFIPGIVEMKKPAIGGHFIYFQSGRLDSNQRPLAPHANALPGCATSRIHLFQAGGKTTLKFDFAKMK
jgi:hypothetical protein